MDHRSEAAHAVLLVPDSLFILARLLSTSDFGIMDMAAFFVLLTNVLAEFGVGTAVLQNARARSPEAGAIEHGLRGAVHVRVWIRGPGLTVGGHFLSRGPVEIVGHRQRRGPVDHRISIGAGGIAAKRPGLQTAFRGGRKFKLCCRPSLQVACALHGMGYWSLVAGAFAGKVTAGDAHVLLTGSRSDLRSPGGRRSKRRCAWGGTWP